MKIADLSNPIALAKIIAESNANTIAVDATGTSYASQTEGFPAVTMIPEEQGGEAPHGLDFNGFLKMLSSHVFNIQNGTPETFNSAVSNLIGGYPKNAQLWLIDNNNSRLLKSTKDDNTDNFLTTPSVIGTSWIDAFPTKDYVDNTFVTKSTAQTITGAKTFTADTKVSKTSPKLDLYNTNLTKGTTPSTLQFARTALLDKDGKFIAMTQYQYLTDGRTEAVLRAYNPNSETSYTQIGIAYKADGTVFTNCPTPTDTTTTSGTQIATTGWVNDVGNNVVHLSGTETITGAKLYTSYIKEQRSNPQVELINTDVTTGTSKNYDQTWWLRFEDTNGRTMGAIRSAYLKDSTNMVIYMRAIKSGSSSDEDFADLSIHYPSSGDPFAKAPNSDVNGSILTTVNKSKSSNGYFQLGNGMVVQWGRVTGITSNTETTVTFPKAFSSSTSYTIVKNYQSNSATEAADREISFYSMTATSAKTFTASTDTNSFSWLAIGY